MSRIGLKLIAIFMSGLVVAIVILSLISVSIASSIIETISTNANVASLKTLENSIADEVGNLSDGLSTIQNFNYALPENQEALETFWAEQRDAESEFLALYDMDGHIYWKSSNFELESLNFNKALSGGWAGFVKDSKAGLTIQVVRPITYNDAKIAVAVLGMSLSDVAWLDKIRDMMGCHLALFDEDLRFNTTLTDETGKRITGVRMNETTSQTVLVEGKSLNVQAVVSGINFFIAYEPLPDIDGDIIGAYCTATDATETDKMIKRLVLTIIFTSIGVAAVMAVVIIILNKKIIITPITEASEVAHEMSEGQFRVVDADFTFANDELGDFVRKLESTKGDLNNYISDIDSVLSAMALGDFTAQPQIEYNGDFAALKVCFSKIEEGLRDIIGNIGNSSRDVRTGSGQIAEGSHMLAEGTTQQAAATQEIAATINDIAEKVHQTAQNAAEASDISTQTGEKIAFQNNEVQDMLQAMDEIKEKSDQIQTIIKAIDDIAFQTNILALNAAIEAARAGSAGKGFAVVADEVRNLAAKSAESAQQTGDLINATIEAVNKGTVIAQSTAETMKDVTDLSNRTNVYIGDITSATVEQAEAINQIKIGIDRISQVVQQNSATSEEIAASCRELSDQAAILETQIARLTV